MSFNLWTDLSNYLTSHIKLSLVICSLYLSSQMTRTSLSLKNWSPRSFIFHLISIWSLFSIVVQFEWKNLRRNYFSRWPEAWLGGRKHHQFRLIQVKEVQYQVTSIFCPTRNHELPKNCDLRKLGTMDLLKSNGDLSEIRIWYFSSTD